MIIQSLNIRWVPEETFLGLKIFESMVQNYWLGCRNFLQKWRDPIFHTCFFFWSPTIIFITIKRKTENQNILAKNPFLQIRKKFGKLLYSQSFKCLDIKDPYKFLQKNQSNFHCYMRSKENIENIIKTTNYITRSCSLMSRRAEKKTFISYSVNSVFKFSIFTQK